MTITRIRVDIPDGVPQSVANVLSEDIQALILRHASDLIRANTALGVAKALERFNVTMRDMADEKLIAAANDEYGGSDVKFDQDAEVSLPDDPDPEGVWVQGWFFVRDWERPVTPERIDYMLRERVISIDLQLPEEQLHQRVLSRISEDYGPDTLFDDGELEDVVNAILNEVSEEVPLDE